MSSNIKQAILWVVGALVFLGIIIGIAIATTPNGGGSSTPQTSEIRPTAEDWIKGSIDATVQIVEYSDLQCPACAGYEPILKQLTGEFGDKIGFTYRHFPLTTLHKNSMQATWVAEAAGAQGKFWEMHDKLLDMQKDWENEANPTDKFISYAQDLGLNIDTFKVDMESSLLHSKVQAQTDSGNRAGVNATPTLFLNGKKLELPRSYQDLKNIVQTELDK